MNLPCNTLILPAKEKDGTWCIVHNLRVINEAMVPTAPNSPQVICYPGQIPPNARWFTVLDLKDAFFCITLARESQFLFAFEWDVPGEKHQ